MNRLWLAHHPPDQLDRCVHLGATPVCRRCLVGHPIAFAVMGLALAGLAWPEPWDRWLLWVLATPAMVDFCGEHLGWWRYSPRRQVITTAVTAAGFGKGLARVMHDRADGLFWTGMLTYGTLCAMSLLLARRRHRAGRARERDAAWEAHMAHQMDALRRQYDGTASPAETAA